MDYRRFQRNPRWSFAVVPLVAVLIMAAVFLPHIQSALPAGALAEAVHRGEVDHVTTSDGNLNVTMVNGRSYYVRREGAGSVTEVLLANGLTADEIASLRITETAEAPVAERLLPILAVLVPLTVIAFGYIFIRPRRHEDRSPPEVLARPTGQVAPRLDGHHPVDPARITTTFADVAGVDEAAEELREVVAFLRNPERFAAMGARVPHGVLLVGPPGTGKTLLARAVAGEAGVPFFSISGSEFVEVYAGVGAARVRNLFVEANKTAPAIVFVDEIDTIGRKRRDGAFAANEEREQTLNQILVEMYGFEKDSGLVVLAATNRPDVLDPALLRPGRFDRRVSVDPPDRAGREAILRIHMRGKPLAEGVELAGIAGATAGFTGADLANLANEAAIVALRRDKPVIGPAELEEALDRVVAGPQRKGHPIPDHDREVIAYHEAGHALVARSVGDQSIVRKVTILARGASGGHTSLVPAEDHALWSRSQLAALLASTLAGRAAEELVFGEITSGSENDLQRATSIARRMVTSLGMSEGLGPVAVGSLEQEGWAAQSAGEYVARRVYEEATQLLAAALAKAHAVLAGDREALDALATALLERETLTTEEVEQIARHPRVAEQSVAAYSSPSVSTTD